MYLSFYAGMTKSTFLGGALSFKGDKKSRKKKSKKTKSKLKMKGEGTYQMDGTKDEKFSPSFDHDDVDDDDELTEAERKALKFKKQRQKEESGKIAQKSHRERVEELNEKLGNMTELNDIPRVSAAGNG